MSEQTETIFGQGFIFKRPREGAPAFVKGSMSVKVSEAIAFLQKYQEKDWVNLDLLASKDNSKLYFKLNTYKPPTETSSTAPVAPVDYGNIPGTNQPYPTGEQQDVPDITSENNPW